MHDTIASVLSALEAVSVGWLVLAVTLHLANMLARSCVWRKVLQLSWPDRAIRVRDVARAYCVGVAVNAVVPARGGDVVKVGLVKARIPGADMPAVAATIAAMSMVDMLIGALIVSGLLVTGAVGLPISVHQLAHVSGSVAWIAVILGAVACAGVMVACIRSAPVRTLLRRLAASIAHGLQGLRSPGWYARKVVPLHMIAWAARISTVYCMASAFHLPATVQIAAAAVAVHGVASLVPVPGGLGAQQAVHVALFAGLSPIAQVLSFSVASQMVTSTLNIAIGTMIMMAMIGTIRPRRAWLHAVQAARSG